MVDALVAAGIASLRTEVRIVLAGRSSTQPNGKHKKDSGGARQAGD